MAPSFLVNKKRLLALASLNHPRTQFTALSPSICPSGREGGGGKLKGIGSERTCLNLRLRFRDKAFYILMKESANPLPLN